MVWLRFRTRSVLHSVTVMMSLPGRFRICSVTRSFVHSFINSFFHLLQSTAYSPNGAAGRGLSSGDARIKEICDFCPPGFTV